MRPSATRPLLSVITPAYNAEPYLAACIESVLGQTLPDLELLVVDDGSTDRTSEVLSRYVARDARVRGFRGPNGGVSRARNVALRHARGRFVALLDADDEWDPSFAAEQVHILRAHPELAIVTGNATNLGGPLHGTPVRPWPAGDRLLGFVDLINEIDAVFVMAVFRREVYEAIGGFNETLVRSEDYEFWLRAAAAGFLIRTNPRPLGRYRRRHDSASANAPAMYESIVRVLTAARTFKHRPTADELNALDQQLGRMHAGRLLTLGKAALLRRDFVEAVSHFRELHRRGEGWKYRALAAALRVAPRLVREAYRQRQRALESGRRTHAVRAEAAAQG